MTLPTSVGGYTVVRALGQGGMGSVLEVTEPGTGRRLALKVIRPDSVDDELRVRFRREAEALALLRHPNVVTIHRLEQTGAGDPFLVMELVEGADLASAGQLPVARAVRVVRALADALAALHAAGVVHRDVKPGNVLLRADGAPVLIDFGLARALDASRLTRTGALIGSPAWMSPEQVQGGHAIGPPADVHALGLVLLFALTGRLAFDGASLQEVLARVASQAPRIPRRVPPRLAAILRRALDKEPAARPSAAALRDALDAWLAAPDAPTPPWPAVALAAAAAAALVAVTLRPPPPPPPPAVAVDPPPVAPVASSAPPEGRRDAGPMGPLRRFRAARADRDLARLRLAMERPLLVVDGLTAAVDREARMVSAAFAADDVLVVHDGDAGRITVVGPRGRREVRVGPGANRAGGFSAGSYLYALRGALRAAPLLPDGGGPDLEASRELIRLAGTDSASAVAVGEELALVGGFRSLAWVRRGGAAASGHLLLGTEEAPEVVRGLGCAGPWIGAALQQGTNAGTPPRTHLVVWDASGEEPRPAGRLDVGNTWIRAMTGAGRDLLLVPALVQGAYVVPLPLPAGATDATSCMATVGEYDVAGLTPVAGPLGAPDARRLVLGRRRGEVTLCALEGGRLSERLPLVRLQEHRLVTVQAAPDGLVFAVTFEDGRAEVWGVPE